MPKPRMQRYNDYTAMINNHNGYCDLSPDYAGTVGINGSFTLNQLRLIVAAMEEIEQKNIELEAHRQKIGFIDCD